MKIYLLIDDPPEEHGNHVIYGAFLYNSRAKKELVRMQKEDEYVTQYLEVRKIDVNLEE